MADLGTIKSTLIRIAKGKDLLDTLMEFERVLDEAEVFAYKNWIKGELIDGPHISRYWYKTTWMYPEKLMPDPDGGLRLLNLDCKVSYTKSKIAIPTKVTGPEDWQDSKTKRAKLEEHNVWLVTVDMPMKYIEKGLDMSDGQLEQELADINDEISKAYSGEDTEEEYATEEVPTEEVPTEMPVEQGTPDANA